MSEDIRDYGATPNDTTDDTDAIAAAMDAAGRNGTIYVPEGTYRIGGSGPQKLYPGRRQPAGISIVGDGAGKSIIKWRDGETGENGSPRGVRYDDSVDHGAVTIDSVTFDGNWQNISLPDSGKGSTAFGFIFDGSGSTSFSCTNVEWTGWWTNGGLARIGDISFSYCTFSEFGLGADSTTNANDGHGFNAGATSGEIIAEDCLFVRGSGVAVDHTDNATGDVRLRRCHVEEVGSGVVKNNPGTGTKYLENVSATNLSGSYVNNTLTDDIATRGVYNVPAHSNGGPLVMNNVLFNGGDWPAVLSEANFDISGDLIVVDNMNANGGQAAAWDVADGGYHDINRMSVVNTAAGSAFYIRGGASGQIQELRRQNNASGLGDTGGVTIGSDNPGVAPHSVDVPARSDVGAAVTTSSDDNTSTTEYGGYHQPGQGTLNWHEPMNENFASIETDVLALHARIEELEKKL